MYTSDHVLAVDVARILAAASPSHIRYMPLGRTSSSGSEGAFVYGQRVRHSCGSPIISRTIGCRRYVHGLSPSWYRSSSRRVEYMSREARRVPMTSNLPFLRRDHTSDSSHSTCFANSFTFDSTTASSTMMRSARAP